MICGHRLGVGGARVAVGGERHRHAGLHELAHRREAVAQEERHAGKRDGHGARRGEGGNAGLRDVQQVRGRGRPQLGGQLGAAQVAQLVRVQVNPPAEPAGVGEQTARLLGGEDPLLAEHVDALGEAGGGDGRVDLLHHQPDVALGIVPPLGRHLVGRHGGGDDLHRVLRPGATRAPAVA